MNKGHPTRDVTITITIPRRLATTLADFCEENYKRERDDSSWYPRGCEYKVEGVRLAKMWKMGRDQIRRAIGWKKPQPPPVKETEAERRAKMPVVWKRFLEAQDNNHKWTPA